MSQSKRQRRKQRRQEQSPRPAGGVAPELREEADVPAMPGDAEAEQVTVTGPGEQGERTFAEAEAETFAEDTEPSCAALIGALGPLRRTRRHSLLPGIRMFTAMLEEARGGYAADRLGQLAEALAIDFNPLETDGILQVAMIEMDETGVPDVEHAVRLCLEARAQIEGEELVEPEEEFDVEDEGELEPQPDVTAPVPDEEEEAPAAFEPQTEEGRRLAATGASQADVEAMDKQVLDAIAEENAATAEDGEPEDHDEPGPDES